MRLYCIKTKRGLGSELGIWGIFAVALPCGGVSVRLFSHGRGGGPLHSRGKRCWQLAPELRLTALLYGGFGAVLGHNWPFWNHGHGGKGVAVTCAWLMLYLPVTGVLCCLAGGIAVLLTGYLPLGAVLIAALAVPVGWLQYGGEAGALLLFNAGIMLTRHWPGLVRMYRGEEPQFFRPKH